MDSSSSSDDEGALALLLGQESELKAEIEELNKFLASQEKSLEAIKKDILHEKRREKLLESCLREVIKEKTMNSTQVEPNPQHSTEASTTKK